MRSKMKLWTAESRIFAQTDTKILLTKVDSLSRQVSESEGIFSELQKQIRGMQAGKLDLQAQMGLMVPVSDLHAAKAETSKLRETNDGLSQLLRSTQGEVEKLSSTIQVNDRNGVCAAILASVLHGYWRSTVYRG